MALLKIVKKVFFGTIHFYCSLVNRIDAYIQKARSDLGGDITWNLELERVVLDIPLTIECMCRAGSGQVLTQPTHMK